MTMALLESAVLLSVRGASPPRNVAVHGKEAAWQGSGAWYKDTRTAQVYEIVHNCRLCNTHLSLLIFKFSFGKRHTKMVAHVATCDTAPTCTSGCWHAYLSQKESKRSDGFAILYALTLAPACMSASCSVCER